ncbi:hypothetical protein ACTXJF_14510, partial [Psychrobacter alimentarius]|uniref:hypothetical protein n=1 Tax=Psychrobacter alimentarius TaxID=261164 RepID=UPI003FD523B3
WSSDYREHIEYTPIDQEIILRYLNNYQIEYSENLLLKTYDGNTVSTNDGISLGFVDNKLVAFGLLVLSI